MLHRNTISFIGMEKRSAYLATKVIADKFVALSNKNVLTTWSILNGKVRMEWTLALNKTGQDYSQYEVYGHNADSSIYRREWYNKILLKSKRPIDSYDENSYFDPE